MRLENERKTSFQLPRPPTRLRWQGNKRQKFPFKLCFPRARAKRRDLRGGEIQLEKELFAKRLVPSPILQVSRMQKLPPGRGNLHFTVHFTGSMGLWWEQLGVARSLGAS